MESVHEEWRSVQGSNGFYEVSNLGNVRSVSRTVLDSSGRLQRKVGAVLKPRHHSAGYRVVNVNADGKSKTKFVHSIVAEAFIGPRPVGHDVNHIDGDKTNNVASNLEYATRKRNMNHAFDVGLFDNRGEKNGQSRFTEEQVRLCHKLLREGRTIAESARLSGISDGAGEHISRNTRWKHLNLEPIGEST